MTEEPRVHFERVNALLAHIRGPGGHADIYFQCDPCNSCVRVVVRIERKQFDPACNLIRFDILEKDPSLTVKNAIQIAQDKVRTA